MYEELLNGAGLSLKEAEIYEILLENGELSAGSIYKKTSLKRSLVYKILEQLEEKGLIRKLNAIGKVAKFRVEHPMKIKEMLEKRAQKVEYYKKSIEELMPQFISSYNLAFNKPGVKFYEGEDGFRKILEDTLTSKTDVLLFINSEALAGEEKFKEINEEYKRKRERAKIVKKIIRSGTKPELTFGTAKEQYDAITEIKYMEEESFPFKASIQIYDGKISYQLIDGENIISILIQDKHIYEMHKAFFEFVWKKI